MVIINIYRKHIWFKHIYLDFEKEIKDYSNHSGNNSGIFPEK